MLKLAYIGLSLLMTLILVMIATRATGSRRTTYIVLSGLLLWQVYIYILASKGILSDFSFPPKFAVFMIMPAFLFTGLFIFKNRNAVWIQEIPESWLIHYQTFRVLVETLFVYAVAAGVLHHHVTIEGYNYDMIFALTAPFMAFLVYQKKSLPKKVLIWWNYLGLAVLASVIFVFITTIFVPELYGSKVPLMPKGFGQFAYMLVPGFLMPSAVFIHILSLVQLKRSLLN